MEKKPARPASFICVDCSKQPARYYCKTCDKLLCLNCSGDHADRNCKVDSCEFIGNKMMKKLLKENESASNNLEIYKSLKNVTLKMKNLFKWMEKEIISKLSECHRKVRKSTLTNEAKQQMIKLKNEENTTELYMLCKKIKGKRTQEESKENIKGELETVKDYQNKIQDMFTEFCKKFIEINREIPMAKQHESSLIVGQKQNIEPQVMSDPIPESKSKIRGILKLMGK